MKWNFFFVVNSRVHRSNKHAQWAARLYLGMAALINISVSLGSCLMSCQPQCSVTAASNPSPSLWSQGARQGCIIAPILSCCLYHCHTPPRCWRAVTGDSSPTLNWWHSPQPWAKSKFSYNTIRELQYTDDNDIMTHSTEDHHGILNTFPKAYWYLALKVKKCQVLHQPPANQLSAQPSIKLDNTRLRNAEHVLYFGSLVSSNADFSSEANHGLCCASGANARAVVLPTCCSWATSWTTYSRHLKALEEHLQRIPRISW